MDTDCITHIESTHVNVKAIAKNVGGVYSIQELGNWSQQSGVHATVKENSQLWHRRLAHLNLRNVRKITGITKGEDDQCCMTCAKCKVTAKPFLRRGVTRATKLLELVHSDVIDIMTTEALGKERYAVTFIDDFSRFGIIYFAKTKDETMDKFKGHATCYVPIRV